MFNFVSLYWFEAFYNTLILKKSHTYEIPFQSVVG